MKPYRVSFEFTCAAEDVDAVGAIEDHLIDAAENVGLLFEGGVTVEMAANEVIPDSPLDHHLKGTCKRCAQAVASREERG